MQACALCQRYSLKGSCEGCPIFSYTGIPTCRRTPYDNWHPEGKTLETAEAEVEFLKKVAEANNWWKPENPLFKEVKEKFPYYEVKEDSIGVCISAPDFWTLDFMRLFRLATKYKAFLRADTGEGKIRFWLHNIGCNEWNEVKTEEEVKTKIPFTDFDGEKLEFGITEGCGHNHLWTFQNGKSLGYFHIIKDGEIFKTSFYPDRDPSPEELLPL
jgi:hypothetical protein